jgi:hypothetical protein
MSGSYMSGLYEYPLYPAALRRANKFYKKKATWVFSPKKFELRRKIRGLLLPSILVQK